MTPEAIIFPSAQPVFATDWRFEAAFRVSTWLEAEYDWWHVNLGWDLRSAWALVEPARARGELPGLAVEDVDGRMIGWSFYLRHGDSLQVAAMLADDRAATVALVDGILASAEAAGAAKIISFTRAQAPGLIPELVARGFAIEPYRYLEVGTAEFASVEAGTDPWRDEDRVRARALLERAYRESTELRPFATNGLPEEWADYLDSLVERDACGRFLPEASGTIAGDTTEALAGAIVMTGISERTAHVAQIAVDPGARGNGLGARLLCAAGRMAHDQGFDRLSLLVAGGNARAASLYDRLGFRQTAMFLAAIRLQAPGAGLQ